MTVPVSVEAYTAARERAGLIDRDRHGRIVVSGADRATYLHGLLTNDIASLTAGRGCYAAYLTAQGRMITDLLVYELGDVMLLTMDRDVTATVLALLDRFIFSEDVTLGDVTDTFEQCAVVGPAAASSVADVLDDVEESTLTGLPEHGNLRASLLGRPAIVVKVTDTGEPGFDLFVERDHAAAVKTALIGAGVTPVDPATADALRIEAGVPVFHRDMDEETIPLEAGIESRAISLTKGCYVGQEVIIRVLHRGHGRVARKLTGLTLDGGAVPLAGAEVRAADRVVGQVTSAAWSPAVRHPVALAYLHRDVLEPGTALTVGESAAVVTALPFVAR